MKLLPVAAAAATGIQVGSAMVATRFVVDQTGPASLALLRYLIGFCCLLPLVLWALNHAAATEVTVFLALSPITAAGLGAALLGERLSPLAGVGVVCVAAGLWLASRPGRGRRSEERRPERCRASSTTRIPTS